MRIQHIGAILTIVSALLFSALLIAGAILSTSLSEWSGSILSAAIFQTNSGLVFPFYFSIFLFILGLILMFWDFIKKNSIL